MISTYILGFSPGVNGEVIGKFELYKDHVFQGIFKVRVADPVGSYNMLRFLVDKLNEPGLCTGRPITIFWDEHGVAREYEKCEPVSESQDIALQLGFRRVRGETDQQIIAALLDPANPNFPTAWKA